MPHLMVSNDFALLRIEQPVAFLETSHYAFHRIGEIVHRHRICAATSGEQCRFVDRYSMMASTSCEPTPSENGGPRCLQLHRSLEAVLHYPWANRKPPPQQSPFALL